MIDERLSLADLFGLRCNFGVLLPVLIRLAPYLAHGVRLGVRELFVAASKQCVPDVLIEALNEFPAKCVDGGYCSQEVLA
ncbi:hypothetical protein D3C77_629090 [compost metagenome]